MWQYLLGGRWVVVAALVLGLGAAPVLAQESSKAFPEVQWVQGPKTVPVGERLARLELSKKFLFLNGEDTRKILKYVKEPVSDQEVGMVLPNTQEKNWTIIVRYDPMGYVKDDEADDLDADGLLASIREGTEEANKEREANGGTPIRVIGWAEKPHYDRKSHHLIWSVLAEAEGERLVNYNTRILGRSGVVSINLVSSEAELTQVKPNVNDVIAHFTYLPEKSYEAFVPGKDPVAEVGLAALILGGTAVAAKTGLLAKLGLLLALVFKKGWFLLLAAPFAFFKKLFGRKSQDNQSQDGQSQDGSGTA
jgi:uncharacterized membrane-anchored protein